MVLTKLPSKNIYLQSHSEYGKIIHSADHKEYLKNIGLSIYDKIKIAPNHGGILIRSRYPYNSHNHNQTIEIHPYPWEKYNIGSLQIENNIGSEIVRDVIKKKSLVEVLFESGNKLLINLGEN